MLLRPFRPGPVALVSSLILILLMASTVTGRELATAPEPIGEHTAVQSDDNAPLLISVPAVDARRDPARDNWQVPKTYAANHLLGSRFDDVGDDDVLVDTAESMRSSDIAIAGNGDIFIAAEIYLSASGSEIRIYRSVDDGDSFGLWGRIHGASVAETYEDPTIALCEGTDDRLFVAYVRRAQGLNDQIRQVYADPFAASASFSAEVTILGQADVDFDAPRLASDAVAHPDYYLYLVAEGQDDSSQDIWFARGTDRGASFETAYKIGNLTTTDRGYFLPDICWGAAGWLHVTWCFEYDTPAQDMALRYRRAESSAGGGDASWEPIVRLTTTSNGMDEYRPRVAASFESSYVAIAYTRRLYVEASDDYILNAPGFLGSDDRGFFFSIEQIVSGPPEVMNDIQYQGTTDNFVSLGRMENAPTVRHADHTALNSWSAARSFGDQAYETDTFWNCGLAVNPTRDEELATSWSGGTSSDSPNRHYFDAEWRGDPTPVVAEDPLVTRIKFAAPAPNPTSGPTLFAYELPVRSQVRMDVFDLRGRRVRTVMREEAPAGSHVSTWDGRDDQGRQLTSGVYFARLQVRGPGLERSLSRKVNLVR